MGLNIAIIYYCRGDIKCGRPIDLNKRSARTYLVIDAILEGIVNNFHSFQSQHCKIAPVTPSQSISHDASDKLFG